MATLVLSTVGTVLGGPIGGAIGSLVGQSIDQQLLGPGPRRGPRLGDLSVQSSTYGSPIPRLFGTMRAAGTIVWSTDLQESSQTTGAKGQPDVVTYSYSVSFAVALSSRPIVGIGRIWADGKVIRTAEGEFTVGTDFRLYDGREDQPVDPLIGSIEGVDSTPAYRGVALAVFENLQLADFGNRIPFLTFEIVADEEPVQLGALLADVSDGAIASSSTDPVQGYAAYGSTTASAVEPLTELFGTPLFDDGHVLATPAAELFETTADEEGCGAGPEARPRSERSQIPSASLPSRVSLTYYDPDRDFQTGLAHASAAASGRELAIELPAVLDSGCAKALAQTTLARRWAERDRLRLRLPPEWLSLRSGALIRPPGTTDVWIAETVTVDSMTVIVDLRPTYAGAVQALADPGRVAPSSPAIPASTQLALIELPDDGTGSADAPIVAVTATSSSPSWRSVPIEVQVGSTISISRTAAVRGTIGAALTALPDGQSTMFDCVNSVDIALSNADDWLEGRNDDALVGGSNLALLGGELIQFGEALPLAGGNFRLRRLLRGRRGSEWAMPLHEIGEQFVLLEPGQLKFVDVSAAEVGGTVRVIPRALADDGSNAAELVASGEAMRPPSPVHLEAAVDRDGTLRCSWVRRSKRGWVWLDGVDAPLGFTSERYRVIFEGSSGLIQVESDFPQVILAAAEVAALGDTADISVVQVGDLAVSRPATVTINIS